jgi:VCBS repeat-containing protein
MESIATVAKVTGKAYARNADGELREIRPGDVLLEGETVVTPDGGSVELTLADGSAFVVSDVPELTLTPDLVAERAPGPDESAVQDETVDAVLAALESGEDLGDVLEATAAGPGGSGPAGDGHSFIRLGRIAEDTDEFNGIIPPFQAADPDSFEQDQTGVDAIDDFETTEYNTPITINVEKNDIFAEGEDVISITEPENGVAVLNDNDTVTYTPNEGFFGEDTFTYTAINPDGSAGDTATVTIIVPGPPVEPEALPKIFITDDQVVEGDVGKVTVFLDKVWNEDVTVKFESADGTAISGADYNPDDGTVTIPAGQISVELEFSTIQDDEDEPVEEFYVNLSDPVNAEIGDPQGVIEIIDDDEPPVPPQISINDVTVAEGNVATLTISLDKEWGEDVQVSFETADGSALQPGDYVSADGTVTIPAGQTSIQVNFNTVEDQTEEPTEQFVVNLSNPVNASIADPQGTVTIIDDDDPVNNPPFAPTETITVNEAALDLVEGGNDIAPGVVEGSNPGSTAETVVGQLDATDPNGDSLTYTAKTEVGVYGTIQINANGSYVYTLTQPFDTDPDADNGPHTELGAESFSYNVSDGQGGFASGSIVINIIDDEPQTQLIQFPGELPPESEVSEAIVPTLNVDESAGEQTPGEDDAGDRMSTADFSGYFATDTTGTTATLDDDIEFGADGPGAVDIDYGLSISTGGGDLPNDGTEGVASGLYAVDETGTGPQRGPQIFLYSVGDAIEGRVGGADGVLYFTLSLDANSGQATLVQAQDDADPQDPNPISIWHPDSLDDDDVVSLDGAGDVEAGDSSITYAINVTQTVTDGDGDTDSATVDLTVARYDAYLGQEVYALNFGDDGPDAKLATDDDGGQGGESGEGPAAILAVDETDGAQQPDEDNAGDRMSSAEFSIYFNTDIEYTNDTADDDVDFGADGPGTIDHDLTITVGDTELSINGLEGVESGLYAVDETSGGKGDQIMLYNNAGVIEGRIGGAFNSPDTVLYFTLTANEAEGELQLSQMFNDGGEPPTDISIWHPDSTDHDDVVSLDGSGDIDIDVTVDYKIHLVQTVTDADGDSDSVSVDLTEGFEADVEGGYIYALNFGDDGPTAMDDGALTAIAVDEDAPKDILFSDLLANDDFGADDPGAVVGLGTTFTAQKGVVTEEDGKFVYTPNEGATGGDKFSYVITDADGDTSEATVFVNIATDSVPDATGATAYVDDDGLDIPNTQPDPGDDDENTNTQLPDEATYSGKLGFDAKSDTPPTDFNFEGMNAGTGVTDTIGTETVTYSWVAANSTLTATITSGARANDSDPRLFTVKVDNAVTGDYTVTLLKNVMHAEDVANEENEATTSTLRYVVVDSDGTPSLPGALVINFDDDMPEAIDPSRALVTNALEGGDSDHGVALDIDLDIDDNIGADQPGTVRFASSSLGATQKTSGGEVITHSVNGAGTTLTGSTAGGGTIYTVTLDPDNGVYDFDLFNPVDAGIEFQINDGDYAPIAGQYDWFSYNSDDASKPDVLVTPFVFVDNGDQSQTPSKSFEGRVNLNSFELGRENNFVLAEQGVRITFVESVGGTPQNGGLYQDATNATLHQFLPIAGGVNGGIVGFSFNGAGKNATASFAAFDDPDDDQDDNPNDGDQEDIVRIIVDGTLVLREDDGSGALFGDVAVNGSQSVTWNVDGSDYDGTVTVSGLVDNSAVAVFTADGYDSVEAWYVSGDGFAIGDFGGTTLIGGGTELSFDLRLEDADGDILAVPDAIEVELTPSNVNTLNAGHDTLDGGSGDDVFAWELADTDATYTVTGFDPAETSGDTLDLRDLLVGENEGSIASYLAVSEVGGSTVISVSRVGALTGDLSADKSNGLIDHEIIVDGVSNLDLGGNPSSIIDDMINAGKLIVDN